MVEITGEIHGCVCLIVRDREYMKRAGLGGWEKRCGLVVDVMRGGVGGREQSSRKKRNVEYEGYIDVKGSFQVTPGG